MKINNRIIAALLATSAIAFGVGAHAEAGTGCAEKGPGMRPERMQMMGERMEQRSEQRLTQFKAQIKPTAQQEPLWQAFADKVKETMKAGMKRMHENAAVAGTAPERMDRMVDAMKARVTAMESVNESFKRFYDSLTPEQKTIADKHHPMADHMAPPRGGARGKGPAAEPRH